MPGTTNQVFDDACARVTVLPPPDEDLDGVPNATDNCPDIINPDQADGDNDGFGNACEVPDAYEPNNSANFASFLGSLEEDDPAIEIHASFNDKSVDTHDFYRVTLLDHDDPSCFLPVAQPRNLIVTLTVPVAQDYDIYVSAAGVPLDSDTSHSQTSQLIVPVDGVCPHDDTADVVVEIRNFSGPATQFLYDLKIQYVKN